MKVNSESDLKPCPSCGESLELREKDGKSIGLYVGADIISEYIECYTCGFMMVKMHPQELPDGIYDVSKPFEEIMKKLREFVQSECIDIWNRCSE